LEPDGEMNRLNFDLTAMENKKVNQKKSLISLFPFKIGNVYF